MGFSRENEDEVIARLVADLPDCRKVCVDIGAKMLENNNVANLIVNHGWRGYLFEMGVKGFHTLCRDFEGYPVCVSHWRVTPSNINDLMPPQADLLTIDIDGNDYWVWQALKASPPIVVIEYNPRRAHGVMKYSEGYEWKEFKARRGKAAYEIFGAAKEAMLELGRQKGYRLAACNQNNLFFVR